MNKKSKLNLKVLKKNDLKKLKKFIFLNWNKKHILANDKKFLLWQHHSNNCLNSVSAIYKKKIIGLQMFIPQNHYDNILPKKQIFLTLFRCLEGKIPGLSIKIFRYLLYNFKPNFLGTTGFSHDMINFHRWQGFKVGLMNHHVAISPFIKNFKIAKIPKKIKKIKKINKQKYKIFKLNKKNINCNSGKSVFKNQTPIKSFKFIYNRYLAHPKYKYLVYGIKKNKETISICVLRLITFKKTSVLKIIDFMGKNSTFPFYNNLFNDLIKKNSSEYIDFYSHGISEKLILAAGFVNRRKYKNLIIPEYFEPFIKKNIDLMYGYINKTNFKVKIFKGDGDRDRPNKLD